MLDLISAFVILFVVVDPPGLATIFLALTADLSPRAKRLVGIEASAIAFGVLAGAALIGSQLLATLGITIASFRIAGGLLLFVIAFEMVFDRRHTRKQDSVAGEAPVSPAAFPLAIPLMAGPGAITAVVLLAGRANGNWFTLGELLGVIAAIMLLAFGVFEVSGTIGRVLGTRGQSVLGRLLGVLLAALAVQYVADGVRALIQP